MQRLVLLLATVSLVAVHAEPESVGYDITRLVTTRGTTATVKLWDGARTLKSHFNGTQKIVFEDLAPAANWQHSALLRVVDKAGKKLEEVAVQFPPVKFETAPVLWGTPKVARAGIEFKLNTFKGDLKVKNPENYYAVFINGMANQRHWNDTSFFYRTLTQIYGYQKDHIFVADGVYKDKQSDLDGSGEDAIGYGSTKEEITQLLGEIAEKLQPADHLLFVINDHGGAIDGESTIATMDGQMKVSEFLPFFKNFKAERALFMYEQCESGGFVRPSILKPGWAAMSASRNDESSWGGIDKQYNWDEWIYHAISAFARQTHDGKGVALEMKDNHVSAQQAFAYSVSKDAAKESPLLESASNARIKMPGTNAFANGIGVDF